MYKRILVPVDGSRFSEQILPYVAWLHRKTGVPLDLLRVVDGEDDKPQAQDALAALARDLPATAACLVNSRGVAQTILDEAARVPGTLVAISSHGRSGLLRAVLGSTALDVLRTGRGPILVFRPQDVETAPRAAEIEQIVVPLDGSEASETILPSAAELARWIGARVTVVSVVDAVQREGIPPGDVMESGYAKLRATQLGERYGVRFGWEVLHGPPDEAIPAFVRTMPRAMVAMTTRGRSAVQSVLMGSVTAATLREGGVPVFTRLPE